jgi:hypothetical protein
MQQTSVDSSVLIAEEPPIRENDEPPQSVVQLPVVRQCTGDCGCCTVNRHIASVSADESMSRHLRREKRSAFVKDARNFRKTGDEYLVPLHVQEATLERVVALVSGCHRLDDGQRATFEAWTAHARHAVDEALGAERALYIRSEGHDPIATRTHEEINALLYAAPMTPEESVGLIQRLRSLLGGSEKS